MIPKPSIKNCAPRGSDFFSMISTIVFNVIETQKKRFGFSATGANVAAVGLDGLVLQSVVISEAIFPLSFWMVPFFLAYSGKVFSVVSLVIFFPFLAIGFFPMSSPFFYINGATLLAFASSFIEKGFRLLLTAMGALFHMPSSLGILIVSRFDQGSQERVTTIPQGSRAKRPEAHSTLKSIFEGDDIVCSAGRPAAVFPTRREDGPRFATSGERNDGNQLGVAAGSIFGIKKSVFNSKDFGVIALDTYAIAH